MKIFLTDKEGGITVDKRVVYLTLSILICCSSYMIPMGVMATPDTAQLVVNSCEVNDVSDTACYNALVSDGGTSYALNKNGHIDAPFQKLNGVSTVTSATLYYDSWGSLSGSWGIYLKDARDGNTIAYTNPAPEDSSETRNSISCNSLTPTQLQNGVWLYIINKDTKGPEAINLDYVYLSVEYSPTSGNAPTVFLVAPDDQTTTNDSTPDHTFYFIDMDDTTATCTLYYNGVSKGIATNAQNNTNTVITASETTDGTYTWWINCSDGEHVTQSQERTITIDTSPPGNEQIAYYSPNSNIVQGWNDGDSTSYTAIDDGVYQPTVPTTSSDYLASRAGDNTVSEFGFPNITEVPDYITLWIYSTTGSNAKYNFYLQQSDITRASKSMESKTDASWQNCTWSSPTGILSNITIELGGCIKSGNGKPKTSTIYAAYLEVGYTVEETNTPPMVYLVNPHDNHMTNDNTPEHQFYFIDPDNLTANCTLYYNGIDMGTNLGVENNTIGSIIPAPVGDGIYSWWMNCTDGISETQSELRAITVDTQIPSINYNAETTTSGHTTNDWAFVNVAISDFGPAGIGDVYFEWNGVNESFDYTDGSNYWENKTGLAEGNYSFRAFVYDSAGNMNNTELRWVDVTTPPLQPIITINYPFNDEYFSLGQTSVIISISTDCNATCQYRTSDFEYGAGINFTTGQGTKFHTFIFNMSYGEIYKLYYRSRNIETNVTNSISTVHTFGVYGRKILTNSMRVTASESYDTGLEGHPRNLLDNIPGTSYITNAAKVWSDSNTLTLTFKLPDKTGYTTENYRVSHFRFRCNNLAMAPNKYDVLVDNVKILADETKTPAVVDRWVMVDVPDTDSTYAGGTFKWIVKGIQSSGTQKVGISDIEIFSTEKLNYVIQSPQLGYIGISRWWNNLQWAYALHVDDVNDVPLTVNKFGSVMPLTIQVWREYTPNFGNVATIVGQGHEYGSHGYSHIQTGTYSYASGRSWAASSKNFIESNVANTSRWGDTLLSLAFPFSDTNFHVAEAVYDTGMRITGQVNSEAGTGVATAWRGWVGGTNTTRDEFDWMHIYRSMGSAKTTHNQFSDGSFELKWNWTRDNGFFADTMIHQEESMHEKYRSNVENDTVGWRCTWGEARSYYYYSQHTVLTYNSTESSSNTKIYDIDINYENDQDINRIWKLPVTFGFNLTELGLSEEGVISYLINTLKLTDISGNQSMVEGFFIEDGILYLSKIIEDGGQITLSDQN